MIQNGLKWFGVRLEVLQPTKQGLTPFLKIARGQMNKFLAKSFFLIKATFKPQIQLSSLGGLNTTENASYLSRAVNHRLKTAHLLRVGCFVWFKMFTR